MKSSTRDDYLAFAAVHAGVNPGGRGESHSMPGGFTLLRLQQLAIDLGIAHSILGKRMELGQIEADAAVSSSSGRGN